MNRIIKAVGEENYSDDPADLIAYSTDASMIEGKVKGVVWPRSTEDIRKVVTIAVQNNLNIVPRGAGTGLAGGAVPDRSLVMDLSRMTDIKVSLSESYAIVEAGVVVDTLNKALEPHGLFFPVIPSSSSVATIGGMIATNAAGNRAIKYGRMMDWLISLEVVDGAGRIYEIKSGFEKFCGTEGTVGIISQAKIKLTKPLGSTTLTVATADTSEDLIAKLASFRGIADVVAIEVMDRLLSKMSGLPERYHLIVEFVGHGGEIKDALEIRRWWEKREACWPIVSSNGYVLMEDPQADNLHPLIDWLDKNGIPYFGHIGLGIVHPAFRKDQKARIAEMHELVKSIGGNVSGEHGIGITKKAFVTEERINMILELKKKYEPNNILNIGKVVP